MQNKYKYHFTTYKGWMNDPNGLVLKDGLYHLYFQYNPDSTEWGNIGWGHATSRDLITWIDHGVVMEPDEHGMIYSGSAITVGEDIYYFYTAAGQDASGRHFTQRMAVSHDGGFTLIKDPDFEVPTICPENRDPKVIYHEETKAYVLCMWLEGNDFALLRSEKVNGPYELTQRFTLPLGFECPNIFKCDDMWFVWTADGFYYPGSFDGYRFRWNGIRHEAYMDRVPYAAQVFSGTNRVIMIPWLRTATVDDRWTGMMGIPRILSTVHNTGTDALLKQSAVTGDDMLIKDGNITEGTADGGTLLHVICD